MSLEALEIQRHTQPIEKELNHQKEKNGLLKKENKKLRDAAKALTAAVERLAHAHLPEGDREALRQSLQKFHAALQGDIP